MNYKSKEENYQDLALKISSQDLLKEYRCPNCGKLFFRAKLSAALIEVKCRNCKKLVRLRTKEV